MIFSSTNARPVGHIIILMNASCSSNYEPAFDDDMQRMEQIGREIAWLNSIKWAAPEPTQSGIHRAAMYAATQPAISHTQPRRALELRPLHPI